MKLWYAYIGSCYCSLKNSVFDISTQQLEQHSFSPIHPEYYEIVSVEAYWGENMNNSQNSVISVTTVGSQENLDVVENSDETAQ